MYSPIIPRDNKRKDEIKHNNIINGAIPKAKLFQKNILYNRKKTPINIKSILRQNPINVMILIGAFDIFTKPIIPKE